MKMRTKGIASMVMVACVGLTAAARGGKPATVVAATDLAWAEVPNSGGVQAARLWGDMAKGAHGIMVAFPPASVHPLHTHSADIKIVVVSGTFRYGPEGGPEKSYGAGSYVMIPGGTKHTSGCTEGAKCILFHEAAGRFDIKLVQGKQP